MQKNAANVVIQNSRSKMEKESGLDRWFKEKWVDISKKDKSGKHPPCGRKDADKGKYPKCRPSKKVTKDTPVTSKELSKSEKKKAVKKKRKAEKKKSKPAGGGSRKPKRAPTIKKKKSSLNFSSKMGALISFLDSGKNKKEADSVVNLVLKFAKEICPPATQDVDLNTENRNATRDDHNYGPLNPAEPSESYWEKISDEWNSTPEEAMTTRCSNCVAFDISPRMKECMPLVDEGLEDKFGGDLPGFDTDKYALEFGYCWMHHFKCLSARTCDTWAGGGPIDSDKESLKWQSKNKFE